MYLAVDIGGSKTLIAAFTHRGEIREKYKFPTPKNYADFISQLAAAITSLGDHDYHAACVASPGRINREEGMGIAYGNLKWRNVPIGPDIEKLINAPVVVENDAKLAGLSEALLVRDTYRKVMYMTISTGIGFGVITDGHIDPDYLNSEGGKIPLEHNGTFMAWEDFASGRAIKERYGKLASEIEDEATWREISRNLAGGLVANIAIVQPEVIIVGGGVGRHFRKYSKYLHAELKKLETPLIPIPPIFQAKRSEEAVIYGCFELAYQRYGRAT